MFLLLKELLASKRDLSRCPSLDAQNILLHSRCAGVCPSTYAQPIKEPSYLSMLRAQTFLKLKKKKIRIKGNARKLKQQVVKRFQDCLEFRSR